MAFEYQPIQLSEPRRIEVPQQLISGNPRRNARLNKLFSWLERRILGIDNTTLEIFERAYDAPIKTERFPENNKGIVRYYKSSGDSAVIVLPKRGTYGYDPAPLIAAYLATNGISVYQLETPFHGSRRVGRLKGGMPVELDQLKIGFRQGITEAMALTDLVEEEHVGICGVSLGAIYASIVYALHKRLSSAFLLGGGSNVAGIMLESKDGFFKYLREQHLKGISQEMLETELREFEPSKHTNSEKSSKLLMVLSSRDKYIPRKYEEELREAWGNPQQYLLPPQRLGNFDIPESLRHLLPAGHLSMLIYAPWLLPRISEHFRGTRR